MTKVHTTKPTSSTQLLRTVNSKAVLTEQASGFRLRKNFKSKAHKKKDIDVLKGGIRKHVVSNLEGGSLLLSAHVIWKLQKIEIFWT